jgi:hypothetical protein
MNPGGCASKQLKASLLRIVCFFIRPHLQKRTFDVSQIKKPAFRLAFTCFGGERGIRTLDTLLAYTHFPGVLLQPLGHLSNAGTKVFHFFGVTKPVLLPKNNFVIFSLVKRDFI